MLDIDHIRNEDQKDVQTFCGTLQVQDSEEIERQRIKPRPIKTQSRLSWLVRRVVSLRRSSPCLPQVIVLSQLIISFFLRGQVVPD